VFLRDSGGGPGGAVKSYYSAASNGNFEQAASLVHAESPSRDSLTNFEGTNPDEIDVSIDSVESLNETESGLSYDANSTGVVQEFEVLEVTLTVSRTAFGEEQTDTSEQRVVMAKNTDGEWKLWRGV
jgi:hypothetical protein